jgi:small subunit ribosomal protein S10
MPLGIGATRLAHVTHGSEDLADSQKIKALGHKIIMEETMVSGGDTTIVSSHER